MPLAEAADIQTRMMRALSTEENEAAEALLTAVLAEIENAVGREGDNIASDTIKAVLKGIAVDAVCRALAVPIGAASTEEGLGAYSYVVRYVEDNGALLTDAEELRARRAVHGSNTASSSPESLIDRWADLRESREVDEDPS